MAGSAAQKWFESLKTKMKEHGFNLDNPACSMFLNDMSRDPVPALYSGGMNVGLSQSELYVKGIVPMGSVTDEQIEQLYLLAKNGKLSLTPTTGSFEDIRNLSVDGDGNCKMTAPLSRMEAAENKFFREDEDAQFTAQRSWKESVLAEMHVHPEYYATPELAAERSDMHLKAAELDEELIEPEQAPVLEKHPVRRTLEVERTLTDLYRESQNGNVRLDELVSAGLIRDEKGMPFTLGNKPWDRLDYITSEIESDKPLFAISPDGNKTYKLDFSKNPVLDKKNPIEKKLIDPKVKADAILTLGGILKQFDSINAGKNQDVVTGYKAMLQGCLIQLEKSPFQEDCNKYLENMSKVAGQIFQNNVTKKAGKTRLALLDISKDIRNVAKCVRNEKLASENTLSYQDKQRIDIASKSVLTLAKINIQSDDPKLKKLANSVLINPSTLDKQVDKHMKSAAFKALYGDSLHPGKDKLLAAAAISSGKDLIKVYNEKNEAIKKEGAEVAEKLDQEKQSRRSAVSKAPVSPDVKEDLKNLIARMKQGLDSLGYEQRTSQEYQQFKQMLDITHIRLQRNNPYMNVRKQMADLATAADKYYLSKTGGKLNSKGFDRFKAASEIRHMSDAVAQNKKPSEYMPAESDLLKEDIAAKMVRYAADQQKALDTAESSLRADRMMNNPKVFRQNLNKVLESPEFKALYGNADLEKLRNDLEKKPSDINKVLASQRKKIEKVTVKEFGAQKKEIEVKKDEAPVK